MNKKKKVIGLVGAILCAAASFFGWGEYKDLVCSPVTGSVLEQVLD